MKVTWQADDIKSGMEINTRGGQNPARIMWQQVDGEGVRYCVVHADKVSMYMTKPELAVQLTESGFVPAALLTL